MVVVTQNIKHNEKPVKHHTTLGNRDKNTKKKKLKHPPTSGCNSPVHRNFPCKKVHKSVKDARPGSRVPLNEGFVTSSVTPYNITNRLRRKDSRRRVKTVLGTCKGRKTLSKKSLKKSPARNRPCGPRERTDPYRDTTRISRP